MILINTKTLELQTFPTADHAYAILSHVWSSEEVSYQEMIAPEKSKATLKKSGYQKLVETCRFACEEHGLEYAWIDTCCIDKSSSAELTEAINSMFAWYRDAKICLAYLSDVGEGHGSFEESRWWFRGWTLQELLAPQKLVFYDTNWKECGTRASMASTIRSVTGIPMSILLKHTSLEDTPIAVRMSWASRRKTTREEDIAYCLLGIFNVNMSMLYGEGMKAFTRLQEAILAQTTDLSLFLWNHDRKDAHYSGLLAHHPSCFDQMRHVEPETIFMQKDFSRTNRGIRFTSDLVWHKSSGLALLSLEHTSHVGDSRSLGIYLRRIGFDQFVRAKPSQQCIIEEKRVHVRTSFTAVSVLTPAEAQNLSASTMTIEMDPTVRVLQSEPQGAWDPTEKSLFATHSGASICFLKLAKSTTIRYLVCCFRKHRWSAEVVDPDGWQTIEAIGFHEYYRDNLNKLQRLVSDSTKVLKHDQSHRLRISLSANEGAYTPPTVRIEVLGKW